jgi:hypothetical protein
MATEKPKEDRVRECVTILRDLQSLGIPLQSPEVAELKQRINAYITEGIAWEGSVDFLAYGRIAEVNLPRRADKPVEVRLRLPRTRGRA